MFPFWCFRGRFWPETSKGKTLAKSEDFGHSLVSFKPGISRKSRNLELTSGGWDFRLSAES